MFEKLLLDLDGDTGDLGNGLLHLGFEKCAHDGADPKHEGDRDNEHPTAHQYNVVVRLVGVCHVCVMASDRFFTHIYSVLPPTYFLSRGKRDEKESVKSLLDV